MQPPFKWIEIYWFAFRQTESIWINNNIMELRLELRSKFPTQIYFKYSVEYSEIWIPFLEHFVSITLNGITIRLPLSPQVWNDIFFLNSLTVLFLQNSKHPRGCSGWYWFGWWHYECLWTKVLICFEFVNKLNAETFVMWMIVDFSFCTVSVYIIVALNWIKLCVQSHATNVGIHCLPIKESTFSGFVVNQFK